MMAAIPVGSWILETVYYKGLRDMVGVVGEGDNDGGDRSIGGGGSGDISNTEYLL